MLYSGFWCEKLHEDSYRMTMVYVPDIVAKVAKLFGKKIYRVSGRSSDICVANGVPDKKDFVSERRPTDFAYITAHSATAADHKCKAFFSGPSTILRGLGCEGCPVQIEESVIRRVDPFSVDAFESEQRGPKHQCL